MLAVKMVLLAVQAPAWAKRGSESAVGWRPQPAVSVATTARITSALGLRSAENTMQSWSAFRVSPLNSMLAASLVPMPGRRRVSDQRPCRLLALGGLPTPVHSSPASMACSPESFSSRWRQRRICTRAHRQAVTPIKVPAAHVIPGANLVP